MSTTEERTPEKAAVALRGVPGETRPVKKKATTKRKPGRPRSAAKKSAPLYTHVDEATAARFEAACGRFRARKVDVLRWAVEDIASGKYTPSHMKPTDGNG